MSYGSYDRHCEAQEPDNRRGSAGGVARRWRSVFSFFASKAEPGSREYRAAGVTNTDVSAVFETHWHPQIKARMRFTCDGIAYEVVGQPREIGRRESMVIQARTLPA